MLRRHGSCRDFGLVVRFRDHVPARFPGGSLSKGCISIVPALVSAAMNVVNSFYISTDVSGVKSEPRITLIFVMGCDWGVGCWVALRGWGDSSDALGMKGMGGMTTAEIGVQGCSRRFVTSWSRFGRLFSMIPQTVAVYDVAVLMGEDVAKADNLEGSHPKGRRLFRLWRR